MLYATVYFMYRDYIYIIIDGLGSIRNVFALTLWEEYLIQLQANLSKLFIGITGKTYQHSDSSVHVFM